MITLYHKEDRLLWLLEELRIGYKVQLGGFREDGLPGSTRIDAQLQQSTDTIYDRITSTIVSSLSGALITKETPVITDDRQVVRETGAIVEYLIEKYGKGRFVPRTSSGKLDNIFFMHFAEGSFLPPLVLRTVFQTVTDKSPYLIRSFTNAILQKVSTAYLNQIIKDNFGLVDTYLQKDGGRAYLAGGKEPTGGDFMMSTPIATVVQSGAFTPEEIPQSMKEYFDRLKSRPAYQAASAHSAPLNLDNTQAKS